MKKFKFYTLLTLVFILSLLILSCSVDKNDSTDLNLNDLDIDLQWKPTTLKFNNSIERDMLIESLIDELYSTNNKTNKGNFENESLHGYNLNVTDDLITIIPIINPNTDDTPDSINTDCPTSEVWTNHGKCYTANCVKEKVAEALAPVSEDKGCQDVRVVRTSLYARVCSRSCQ